TSHTDYLRHTQEETATLREIVKSERLLNTLNTSLDYACKYTKHIQELLIILKQTCHCINDLGTKLMAMTQKNNDKKIRFTEHIPSSGNIPVKTTSSTNVVSNTHVLSSTGVNLLSSASGSQPQGNTKKDTKATLSVPTSKLNVNSDLKFATCNGCLFSDNHDSCVLAYINSVNARIKSKSVKKPVNRKIWQPTGKMFTNVGHIWRPTGRTFTLVGNVCPLTRITTTAIVPFREHIPIENNTDKPVVTLVSSRKSKPAKKEVPVSNSKINKSLVANKKEPNKSWDPHFPLFHLHLLNAGYPNCSLVFGLQMLQSYDGRSFSTHQLRTEIFGTRAQSILDGVNLLTGSRGNNLYTLSLQDMMASSPICLLSKASKTKSWLWHRRLSHLNFGAINHLARQGLEDEEDDGEDDEEDEGGDDEQKFDEEEFIHSSLSTHTEEEAKDEESFDPIPKTPKNSDDERQCSYPIDPEMLKVDVASLALKLQNNKTVHSNYLRHTQEETTTLREIVEQGRSLNPLNNSLDYAYGIGKDHTIFSLIDGLIKFEKFGPDRKKNTFEAYNGSVALNILKIIRNLETPKSYITDFVVELHDSAILIVVKNLLKMVPNTVGGGIGGQNHINKFRRDCDIHTYSHMTTNVARPVIVVIEWDRMQGIEKEASKQAKQKRKKNESYNLQQFRTMDTTIDQQVARDEALVPHAKRLRIGRSNFRLLSDIKSKEFTLQLVYDVLRLCPFFKAFLVTADVPEIYMQEFWATTTVHHHSIRFNMDNKKHIVNLESFREMLHICPRLPHQPFVEPPFKEEILAFLRVLRHSGLIRKLTDVNINKLHQPWRSFAAIFNKCLISKSSGYDSLWLSQAQILDDHMFSTIKLVSRHQNTQQFGALLPIELTNEDIRNSNAYQEYYAVAIGVIPPKPKAHVRKTRSSFDTTITPLTAAAGPRLATSEKGKQAAKASKAKSLSSLSEKKSNEMYYPRFTKAIIYHFMTKDPSIPKSNKQTHISQPSGSGSDEGTSDDDDADQEVVRDDDKDDNEEGGGNEQESDEERMEEESFNPIPQTPENSEDEDSYLRGTSSYNNTNYDIFYHCHYNNKSSTNSSNNSSERYHSKSVNIRKLTLFGWSWLIKEVKRDDEKDDEEEGGYDEQEYDEEEFLYAEEEPRDEESFDLILKTPEDTDDEGNGEEDLGLNVCKEKGHDEEEEEDELYRDVNINQGRGIQMTQEVEDSHVTLIF
nr:integrase, catalytic region, zinc finger, CCHC-type, peptidase aspartic, catalytic [Tanacetum cinerariifolium]